MPEKHKPITERFPLLARRFSEQEMPQIIPSLPEGFGEDLSPQYGENMFGPKNDYTMPDDALSGYKGERARYEYLPEMKRDLLETIPEPPPIEGAHVPSALMKMYRWAFPEAYRTGHRLLHGTYKDYGFPTAKAAYYDVMPDKLAEAISQGWGWFPGGSMIRVPSGKAYPGAFLHRTIGDPGELEFLNTLIEKGKKSDVASSIITPTQTQIFHGAQKYLEPGLIFNVKDPSNIRTASPVDMFSFPAKTELLDSVKEQRYNLAIRKLEKILENDLHWQFSHPGLKWNASDKAYEAINRLGEALNNMPRSKRLLPESILGLSEEDLPMKFAPIDITSKDVLGKLWTDQLKALKTLEENPRNYKLLNELIYKMGDPTELAGVRYGPGGGGKRNAEFNSLLEQLAWKYKLPEWNFKPITKKSEAIKGLSQWLKEPMKYKWRKSMREELPHGYVTTEYPEYEIPLKEYLDQIDLQDLLKAESW